MCDTDEKGERCEEEHQTLVYIIAQLPLKQVIGFREKRVKQVHCLFRDQWTQKGASASVYEEGNRGLLYKMHMR